MKKLYLILLILFALSSCKESPDLVDLPTIAGTWRFNGDPDYTVEFILDYGKIPAKEKHYLKEGMLHLREGKLVTRVRGHIEDTVDIVDFMQGEGEALIALAEDSPIGRRLAMKIKNKENIFMSIGFFILDDPQAPPRPLPEGHYIKVK